VTTFVKARWPFPPPGCGLALGALFLTSCGGGGPAPGPTAVSQTPPPAPTAVTETPPPEPTWASLSQADAIWQQITSTVTLVKPILRPAYLPPDLTEVRLNVAGWGYFGMAYEDVTHDKWIHLVVGWVGNTDLGGPRSQQQQVVVRNTRATYQLDNVEDPLGDAWLLWEEPGQLGAPGDPSLPNLDHVTYYMLSRGFSKDDLIKVADSLQPVE
jgi:hypothetical protein